MTDEARFEALVEQSLVGIYTIEGGQLRYANLGFARIFGYDSADEIVGQLPVLALIAPEDRERVGHSLERSLSGRDGEMRYRFAGLKKDGSKVYVEVDVRTWVFEGRPAVIGVLIDVTALYHAENRLAHQAFYDGLTGLPNRTLFFDRLQQALTMARREDTLVAVLALDLNGFKEVNARHGHVAGDQALAAVAGRFAGTLRATDTLARLGGDEFGIIASGLTFGDDVIPVAQKIIAALEAPVIAAGYTVKLGVSIGIALYPHHADEPDSLYRKADMAMYCAKQKGDRGYCFVDEEAPASEG